MMYDSAYTVSCLEF